MTLIPNVRHWLEQQGLSLEMQTASAFRAAGFDTRQSTYYTDPETNKPREIDVQAVRNSIFGAIDVRFFVECKSGNKPWILLSSDDTLSGYNRLFAFGVLSSRARDAISARFVELLDKIPWLAKNGVIAAYSVRQAFSDVDWPYSAAVSVIKACQNRVARKEGRTQFLHFAFPVIVINTPLIGCLLNSAGEMELAEVEQGEFLFRGHEAGACIRIVTAPYLPTFAQEAKQIADTLISELHGDEERLKASMTRTGK